MEGKEEDVRLGANKFVERQPIGTTTQTDKDCKEPPLAPLFEPLVGVDCIQMGPRDLSTSMGYLWDPGHKKVRQTLRMAEKKVLESGKAHLAGFAMPHDLPLELRARGYKMVSGAVDVGLFKSAAMEDVRWFRATAEGDGGEDEEVKDEEYWSE